MAPCLARRHVRIGHRLAERGLDGQPVQVDARRRLAELRVVPAAEPSRDLHHDRAVGAEADLRVRRAVADADRVHRGARSLDDGIGLVLGRPDVREGDAERRRLGRHPVGDRQRRRTARPARTR